MNNSVLISLAFLKINSDCNKSIFIDNFIPFVAETIRQSENEVISLNELQTNLQSIFGICIPLHVLKAILFRAKKKNLIRVKNNVFYRNQNMIESLAFRETQQKVQRIYVALIDDFIRYCNEKYETRINEQEAEQIILAFISYNQLSFYQTASVNRVVPAIPVIGKDKKIIISDYIANAKLRNPQVYEYLDTIVKGYLITNVLYFADLHNTGKKFKGTKVFLDTTFIMYALGYSGSEMRAPCTELLNLLYVGNAHLCCFRHTVEEIKGILDACSNRLGIYKDGTFGRSVEYFTTMGYSVSDVQLLISKLERNIEQLRIKIIDKPDYSDHDHVIGESDLNSIIKKKMPHQRDLAVDRDVDSIAAIYRIRKGESFFNIEDSSAFFVTTTLALASACNEYHYKFHEEYTAPPCITDFALTNILWLKTPTKAPDLPMKMIIADSYAAIQPDEVLMNRWLKEVEKLGQRESVTAEDYYFMRYSAEVKSALIEVTLGDPDVITEGTVPQILERANRKIVSEAEQIANNERRNRLESEAQYSHLLTATKREKQQRDDKLRIKSQKFAKWIIVSLRIASIALLAFLSIISLPHDLLVPDANIGIYLQQWPRFIKSGLFVLLAITNVISQFFGVSVISFLKSVEMRFENLFYHFLRSLVED